MSRAAIVLLFACGLAVAAPVPKEKVKTLGDFGEVTDARGECSLELKPAGVVRVAVPKEEPPFVLEHQKLPPVLTRKAIEGDFVLTVRVTHTPPSEAGNAKENRFNLVATSAGVAVVGEGGGKESVVLVHRHVKKQSDGWVSGVSHFTNHSKGSTGKVEAGAELVTEPVWLRLTRRGETVVSEASADGKKWAEVVSHPTLGLGTKLTVGLIAYQSTDSDYQATFDEFKIEPLTEDKK